MTHFPKWLAIVHMGLEEPTMEGGDFSPRKIFLVDPG
jgi:hypothetical protein